MNRSMIMQRLWATLRPNYQIDADGRRERVKRTLSKGVFGRKIIAEVKIRGVEYGYHATKGYRRRRVEAA